MHLRCVTTTWTRFQKFLSVTCFVITPVGRRHLRHQPPTAPPGVLRGGVSAMPPTPLEDGRPLPAGSALVLGQESKASVDAGHRAGAPGLWLCVGRGSTPLPCPPCLPVARGLMERLTRAGVRAGLCPASGRDSGPECPVHRGSTCRSWRALGRTASPLPPEGPVATWLRSPP